MGAHCAPAILKQVGADPLLVTQQGSHLATTAVLLVGPGLALWAMDAATRRLLGKRILQRLCMLHWQVCYPRCCMSQRSSWPHGSKGFLRVAWPSQKNHNTPGLLPMMQLPKHALPAEMPAVRSIMLAGGQHTCLLSCRSSTGAISEAGLLIHAPCLGYQLGVLAGHLPVRERDLVTSEASALYIARLSCTGLQQACTRACTTCVMTLHSESCSCSMVHVVPALLTCSHTHPL